MKKITTILAALAFSVAAHAQSQDEATPVPVEAAASAPAPAASTPEDAASAAPKEIVVRDGFIRELQHCGSNAGGKGTSYGHRASNAVAQVGGFGIFGTIVRMTVASVAGNVVGDAIDDPADERKICVTVAFKDGAADLKTDVPATSGERMRRKDPVKVSFVDGQPSFKFN